MTSKNRTPAQIAHSFNRKGKPFVNWGGKNKELVKRQIGNNSRLCLTGRQLSDEHKRNIANAMKRVTKNSAWKAALSKSLKGRTHSADRIAAIINGVKNSRREHRKMTKPEIWVADVLKLIFGKNYEIYKYTGDRKFWINTSDAKYRNPDFINEHDKKIIEVFGRYWHRNDNPDEVISEYKKAGWDCLIIWDDEINGSIVDDIEFFTYPYDVIERQKQLA